MSVHDQRRFLLRLLTQREQKLRHKHKLASVVQKWNSLPTQVRLGAHPQKVKRRLAVNLGNYGYTPARDASIRHAPNSNFNDPPQPTRQAKQAALRQYTRRKHR